MAKYENNYIESLNRVVAAGETRLSILRDYIRNYKALGHYNPETGVIALVLGMPIEDTEPNVPVAK